MLIGLSGVPSSGKTTLAKRLAERDGFLVYNIFELAKQYDCVGEFDKEMNCHEIFVDKLGKHVLELSNNDVDILLDGHLSHHIQVDYVIILRLHPTKLANRLKKRDYSKEKIKENIEAECLDVITQEAVQMKRDVIEINVTLMNKEQVYQEVIAIYKLLKKPLKVLNEGVIIEPLKKYRPGIIDWSEEILKWC